MMNTHAMPVPPCGVHGDNDGDGDGYENVTLKSEFTLPQTLSRLFPLV